MPLRMCIIGVGLTNTREVVTAHTSQKGQCVEAKLQCSVHVLAHEQCYQMSSHTGEEGCATHAATRITHGCPSQPTHPPTPTSRHHCRAAARS